MRILLLRQSAAEGGDPESSAEVDEFAARLRRLLPALELDECWELDEPTLVAVEGRHYDIVAFAQAGRDVDADEDFDTLLAPITRIRATAPRVPLLCVAVEGNVWLAAAAIKYGANDYLPLESLADHVLARAIKEGLAGCRLPTANRKGAGAVAAALDPTFGPGQRREVTATRLSSSRGTTRRSLVEIGDTSGLENAPDIPGYRIVRRVGEGGTATTYLALDERRQRHVVVKFMPYLEKLGNLDNVRVFQREYDVIAAMNDRRVVRVYDSGVRDDGAYLVVEYFPGGDLGRRMRRPITTRDALVYARQIAQALKLIHAHDIFHRDLKPGNVMLREDGSVALIDFGLAKLPVGQTLAQAGRVLGTPSYLSPEQATGAKIDASSDIYSLGCVLYEMLSGERPYKAESAIRMIDQHVRAPVPQLADALAQLQPLIERMMAKKREERFRSAQEVIVAIDAALAELPRESAAG